MICVPKEHSVVEDASMVCLISVKAAIVFIFETPSLFGLSGDISE